MVPRNIQYPGRQCAALSSSTSINPSRIFPEKEKTPHIVEENQANKHTKQKGGKVRTESTHFRASLTFEPQKYESS